MKRNRGFVGLRVVAHLGEFRIQDACGQFAGSGSSNATNFEAFERFVREHEAADRDSLGYVWTTRAAADRVLARAVLAILSNRPSA